MSISIAAATICYIVYTVFEALEPNKLPKDHIEKKYNEEYRKKAHERLVAEGRGLNNERN